MKNYPLMRLQTLAQFFAFCAALLLAGCGGGGGGGASPETAQTTTTTQQPPTTTVQLPQPTDLQPPPYKSPFQPIKRPEMFGEVQYVKNPQEFKNSREFQYALHNAHHAYARGATGEGEIVGVNDNFILKDHREFKVFDEDGKPIGSKVALAPNALAPSADCLLACSHGTKVTGIIAANRDNKGNMHGIAFDARIVYDSARIDPDLGIRIPGTSPHSGFNIDKFTEEADKSLAKNWLNLDFARNGGASIVNFSFSLDETDIDKLDSEKVREKFTHIAAGLEQKDTPPEDKIIVVWAAANEREECLGPCGSPYFRPRVNPTSPSILAGLGVHFPELRGHVLAVMSVNDKKEQSNFSNPCGSAKEFCLAAYGGEEHSYPKPSSGLRAPTHEDEGPKKNSKKLYADNVIGTSYAAPQVSGGLALLRQYFRNDNDTRQLGNTELVARLLKTADKDFKSYNSKIHGQGIMDLKAATEPYCSDGTDGCMTTALSTDPNAQPFDASAFTLSGNAFGGAMRDSLGGVKIAAFDELDAPFFFPLADGVSHAPQISAGHSDTLHEHELSLGGAANASLALSLAAGELSAARIRRGNLWFSYGHHGGREAGLYFGENKNPIANFGMNFS
ncbi:MAG: S8 family serine peptidase, partial [Gammaproteobacteria bacterium]|nr:S8 family serine peptidase [Gammaproteobacteria bacterium]